LLTNVLGDYLDSISERNFDFPFMALLRAQGFYDIHFTHGQVEFGKDFIAKQSLNGNIFQYSFQLKAGNINQATWRNDIQGQMLEAVISRLSHPCFDHTVPHQNVLVITGRLIGNASLGMEDLNRTIVDKYRSRRIQLWDREKLIDMLVSAGLEEFYSTTSSGHMGYGDFHILYGKSLKGYISEKDIENHSKNWLDDLVISKNRVLGAILESEIITQNCRRNGFFYESIHSQLSALRVILFEINNVQDPSDDIFLNKILSSAVINLARDCFEYTTHVQKSWEESGHDLVKIIPGTGKIFTYLVNCARILEIAGLAFFLVQSPDEKQVLCKFISNFILSEQGCSHIPSDRYAVSIVFPVLALKKCERNEVALEFLHRLTIWLCDRYEQGNGIAGIGKSPLEEISILLGAPFSFIATMKRNDNYLATVLSDLAAFFEDDIFYSKVINDIRAVKIFPTYWQISDNNDLFIIEGRSIISYPNIEYLDHLKRFNDYDFAQHIIHEERTYGLSQKVSPVSIMTLMLLLRDRYFPTLWNLLIE